MRSCVAFVFVLSLMAGCSPYIPDKQDFGTSALAPSAETPPEFAGFNNYNPSVNGLLASQLCATGYARVDQKSLDAAPGTLVQARAQCLPHRPLIGNSGLLPGIE